MAKVPYSVHEELKNLKQRLANYKKWAQEDKEKIDALKKLWKMD